MSKKIQNRFIFPAAAAVCFMLAACDVPLPTTELTEAKAAISDAYQYSADKYAKEELAAAVKLLTDAHSQVKDDKSDEAAKTAVKAKEKAIEALNKALPLYAQQAMTAAKTDLAAVKSFNSAELAPDETVKAETLLSEADKNYSGASYIDAHDKAVESSSWSAKAQVKVLSYLPALEGQLAALQTSFDELKALKAEEFAKDKMDSLSADIPAIRGHIDAKRVKEARALLTAASAKAAEIRDIALSSEARKKIAVAEDAAAKVSASPKAASFETEITLAKETIKSANDSFAKKDYEGASASADAALDIIARISADMETQAVGNSEPEKTVSDTAASADAAVSTDEVKPAPKEEARVYVVVRRKINTDCLWRIAEKEYKDAKMWPLIYMANRSQIKDPDLIYPGQKLIIPPIPVKEKPKAEPDGKTKEPEVSKPDAQTPAAETQPVPVQPDFQKGTP